MALMLQVGDYADCGFNRNVDAFGLCRRRGSAMVKLKSKADLHGAHFEKPDGTLAFPGTFESAEPFREERALVFSHGQLGYLDLAGHLAIPYAVHVGKNAFLIDKNGAKITTKTWDHVLAFSEGLASFQLNNLWGLMNRGGTEIVPAIYPGPIVFSDGLAEFKHSTGKQRIPRQKWQRGNSANI